MRRALHKVATWLALAACGLMATAPVQAFVVCLEPDGTIAFESCGDTSPCPAPESEDSGAIEFVDLRVDCCACIDIPLPTQDQEPRLKPGGFDLPALGVALPASASPVLILPPELLLGPARPRPGPPRNHAPVRTLVLRI